MVSDVQIEKCKTDRYGEDSLIIDCYCKAKSESDAFNQLCKYCDKNNYDVCCDRDFDYLVSIGCVGEFNPLKDVILEITEIDTNYYYICSLIYKK